MVGGRYLPRGVYARVQIKSSSAIWLRTS
jgi:hypothetical protein